MSLRRRGEWAVGLALLLLPVMVACSRPLTRARELVPATHPPPDTPAPAPTWTVTPPPIPTLPPPVATVAPLPTVVAQPTPAPTLAVIPQVVSQPAPIPTPFPDAQQIVDAVVDTGTGTGTGEHWANYLVSGSVTARGADEWLALVGNIGDHNEVRWVTVGQTDEGWQLRTTSHRLGCGFDAPPSFDLPPDLLDFDDDGRQEVLGHHSRMQGGRMTAVDTLYRWDGHTLAPVWEAPTAMEEEGKDEDTLAGDPTVPGPHRASYRAEWEWVDLDGAGLDEILLHEHVTLYQPGDERTGGDDRPGSGEEDGERDWEEAGEENEQRAFRWDGQAFRPYAPAGPTATFAYVASGDVWLWQNRAARPLGAEHVREIRWSPDGRRIAWWAQPPLETVSASPSASPSKSAVLGTYDVTTGFWREFALEKEQEHGPLAFDWASDRLLAYALPSQPPALLDPETGQQAPLPVATLGAWSPDGSRIAYARDGSLYVYDLSTCRERALLVAPAEGGSANLAVLSDLAWSPRGDWIACYLSNHDFTWVGMVAPDLPEPLSALDLLETFGGRQAPVVQLTWSPDGSRLAVLATDPRLARQPARSGKPSTSSVEPLGRAAPSSRSVDPLGRAALYLAEVPHREADPVGRPEWQQVLELETVTHQAAGPAWSTDGERLAFAAGGELWEVTAAGEATLRHRFSFPPPRWNTLEWAPDGSGALAGLEGVVHDRLYWFPADGAEPVLLLSDSLGAAHWSPRITEVQPCSLEQAPMVLVEYTGYKPRLHFVDGDGSENVVRASRANRGAPFQIGGGRVYYYRYYADRRRVRTLRAPRALADCRPPMVSPDGEQLAWLCDDGLPDAGAVMDGTAEIHFRLIVTDRRGRDVREAWHHVETGPSYRSIRLMGWRADGEVFYLSRPKYGAAWAYFEYNPGILALDATATITDSHAAQIGDLDGVHDGLVSPDGAWLAQSRVGEWPDEGVTVTLRSLVGQAARALGCAPGAMAAGDFSFSPHNTWLAWRERVAAPGGANLLIRALRLPDGEPLTVYEDAEDVAPRIGGWLRRDDLVLVYPLREDGTGEYSTVVTLPATGPGAPFSPFVFLGLLGEDPCRASTGSTALSSSHGGSPHPIDTLDRSEAATQSMLHDIAWPSTCNP